MGISEFETLEYYNSPLSEDLSSHWSKKLESYLIVPIP